MWLVVTRNLVHLVVRHARFSPALECNDESSLHPSQQCSRNSRATKTNVRTSCLFYCLFGRICGSIPDKLWNSCFFCSFLRVSGHLKYGGQILNVPIWSISHPQWFGEPLRRRPRISPSPCRSGVMRGQRREGRNPSVEPERRSSW